MSEREFTIQDMINAAISQTPSEFQTAFNNVVLNKVVDSIAAQKEIVAKDYFNKFVNNDDQNEDDDEDEDGLDNEGSDDQEGNENEDVETNS